MYMSYCRFEGTKQELNACINDVQDHVMEEAEEEISERETECFRTMVFNFVEFLNEMEIIDSEIDEEALEEVCRAMKKAYTPSWAEEDENDA